MVEEAAEDGMPLGSMVTSGQERTLDRARTTWYTPSRVSRTTVYLSGRDLPRSLDLLFRMLLAKMQNFGGDTEDGKRRENRIGSASKVIIAVAVVDSIAVTILLVKVTILLVALILLLVDPIDDVLMAIL